MKITLESRLRKFIHENVRLGKYASANKLIEAAVARLMLDQNPRVDEKTLGAIQEGEMQLDRGEGIPTEEAFAKLRNQVARVDSIQKNPAERYVARLLFQFRVDIQGDSGKRRICEDRMIQLYAPSVKAALKIAKQRGRTSRYSYKNDEGNQVCFEFVGVMDLRNLGIECEPDEVWYDICQLLTPMERKSHFIPSDKHLIENAGLECRDKPA